MISNKSFANAFISNGWLYRDIYSYSSLIKITSFSSRRTVPQKLNTASSDEFRNFKHENELIAASKEEPDANKTKYLKKVKKIDSADGTIARKSSDCDTSLPSKSEQRDTSSGTNVLGSRLSRAIAKATATKHIKVHNKSTDAEKILFTSSSIPNKQTTNVKSLTQLTQMIDSQLYENRLRGNFRSHHPKLDGIVKTARDSMISLLGFNEAKGDWKIHSSPKTHHVVIVMGKNLVRDQVTVEYASRIRTLVRLLKEENEFRPSLVCFCGGICESRNRIANADAGYIFFRHICEAQNIDLTDIKIFVDNRSQTDTEAMKFVTEKVKNDYVPDWLDASPNRTDSMQKQIDLHFTLISTEYHLCNINDVHHRSPRQSPFAAIESLGGESSENRVTRKAPVAPSSVKPATLDFLHYYEDYVVSNNGVNIKSPQINSISNKSKQEGRGIIKSSWSFHYATYPFIFAENDSTAFLGKCYLLGQELTPLLVNMKGVVDQKEFFQRDNYLMLASIRRSLVEAIEELHRPSRSRKRTLNNELRRMKDSSGTDIDVITILESALLSLGRCLDVVKPAGMHLGSVSKDDWKRALKALQYSMNEIVEYCDPDRPLSPQEWREVVEK
jgi:hypothetical protein